MRRITLILAALVLSLGLVACDGDGGDTNGARPDFASMQAALQPFEDCEAIETYVKDMLLAEMETRVSWYEQCLETEDCPYWYGIGAARGGSGGWAVDDAVDMGVDAPTSGSDGDPGAPAPSGGEGSSQGDSNGSDGGGEEPFSETNNQEEGVDEADIVKTDGEYLYILDGSVLRIVKAAPVEEMGLASTVNIEGNVLEMFLAGDRVAVFSATYNYNYNDYDGYDDKPPMPTTDIGVEPAPDDAGAPAVPPTDEEERAEDETTSPIAELDGEILKFTLLDVSDRANPQVLRETYFEAGYVSARMVNGTAHLVLRSHPTAPYFEWYGFYNHMYPDDGGDVMEPSTGSGSSGGSAVDGGTTVAVDAGSSTDPDEPREEPAPMPAETPDAPEFAAKQAPLEVYEMTLEQARAAYIEQIDALTLEDIAPKRIDVVDGVATTSYIIGCDELFHPSIELGFDLLAVISFDMDADDQTLNGAGILGSSANIYASQDTIYAATYVYDYWMWEALALEDPNSGADQRTIIHAFDIASAPGQAVYSASGFVPGQILNQFAMSEFAGYFRVATTTRDWNNWGEDGDRDSTDNGVYVLQKSGSNLAEVARLEGLGMPDEQIYAARFFGDTGFVVTFRNMDPLYAIDLTNPLMPTLRGELHVPGYSSYIHPLGEDHLLTIGRGSIEGGEFGWLDSVKLSIYDVTDLDNPVEAVESYLLPGSSEAEYQHKAFNYFGHHGLLAVPMESYWWGGEGELPPNGLSVFGIDTSAGISPRGTISHADLMGDLTPPDENYYCEFYMPNVRRSVFIGDRVYSISSLGVKANGVGDGLPELGRVVFEDAQDSYGYRWGCWPMEDWGGEDDWATEIEPDAEPTDPEPEPRG